METKKLYRSKKDRVFAGVCGGIGEYLGVDPTVIRLLAVILGFTGSGVLAYIVAAILITGNRYIKEVPKDPDMQSVYQGFFAVKNFIKVLKLFAM